MKTFHFLPSLIAGLCFALPATGLSDHKGSHHNSHGSRDHGYYGGHGYYSRGYYNRGYYGGSYYGYPDYYYGYPRTSVGIAFSSRPYYSGSTVYRGRAAYGDDLAVDVQSALRRRGYYRGPIDGDIGPGSRAAIRAYQAQRGLAVTGRIDSSLLRSLGLD